MSSRHTYTIEQLEFIAKNSSLVSDREGAEQFSKIFFPIKQQTWTKQRQKIGLRKTSGVKSKIIKNETDQKVAASPQPHNNDAVVQLSIIDSDIENKQESTHDRF